MLDINEINATIRELESGPTTYDSCMKLASLYTVRNELGGQPIITDEVLPQYRNYCRVKQQYQMHEVSEEMVFKSMAKVCVELAEFIKVLYSCTDTEQERNQIRHLTTDIYNSYGGEYESREY